MILIVVKFKVKPEWSERWLEHVHEFTEATRAEPGNLWFDWSRSVDDPDEWVLVEAFEDAAIVSGLSAGVGRELALTTMVGTARMLDRKNLTCGELRRQVTSPGGTAAAGLAHMERSAVRGSIIDAVVAARDRARELG